MIYAGVWCTCRECNWTNRKKMIWPSQQLQPPVTSEVNSNRGWLVFVEHLAEWLICHCNRVSTQCPSLRRMTGLASLIKIWIWRKLDWTCPQIKLLWKLWALQNLLKQRMSSHFQMNLLELKMMMKSKSPKFELSLMIKFDLSMRPDHIYVVFQYSSSQWPLLFLFFSSLSL